jgi:hypothetical protein
MDSEAETVLSRFLPVAAVLARRRRYAAWHLGRMIT